MRLIDAPVGLFLYKGEMCLKTEYIADWGVEAYIVSSGEVFWGDAKTVNERRYVEVTPIEAEPVRNGQWEECDWVEYDGHSECVRYPKKGRVCTNCRNAFKKEFVDSPRVHYCPHCGAKMESGTALSEAEPLEWCVDGIDLEHMTRFAMQQALKQK